MEIPSSLPSLSLSLSLLKSSFKGPARRLNVVLPFFILPGVKESRCILVSAARLTLGTFNTRHVVITCVGRTTNCFYNGRRQEGCQMTKYCIFSEIEHYYTLFLALSAIQTEQREKTHTSTQGHSTIKRLGQMFVLAEVANLDS
jgi:hypothetical protein